MLKVGSLFSGCGGIDAACERAGMRVAWQCEIDKTARRVLRHHWPGVPCHEDVRGINGDNVPAVDVLAGGFPCFPAGTSVLCRDGFRDISHVAVGDEVLTHQGRWMPVTATMRRKSPVIRLRGHGHPAMVTTDEHPFYAITSGRKWRNSPRGWDRVFSVPEWVPARDMQGKFWASPAAFPDDDVPVIELQSRERAVPGFSTELFWIIGAWLGDGWLNLRQRSGRPQGQTSGQVIICAGRHEADDLQARIIAAGLRASRAEERTTTRFIITARPLARWLKAHFGCMAGEKRIPAWALGMAEEYRRALFDGYAWADGSHVRAGNRTHTKITSINKTLLIGAKLLAQSLGHSVALHVAVNRRQPEIEGRRVNEQPVWQLVAERSARSSVVIGLHRYGLVRQVMPEEGEREVFNIEVAGDNSYVADGIVVHNCQDLSVAGRRAGLAGERSGLFYEFMRLIAELAPTWVLIENVPGLLSSNNGRDMGAVIGSLGQLGYGYAWRVLDAQWFGVPQRRRRVFIVGHLGDRRAPATVLFEPESLRRDTPPRRQTRETVAGTLGGGSGERGWAPDTDRMTFIPTAFDWQSGGDVRLNISTRHTSALHVGQAPAIAHTLRAEGHDASEDGTGRGTPLVAIQTTGYQGDRVIPPHSTWPSLSAQGGNNGGGAGALALDSMAVRRITPLEASRLQGYPDSWLDIPGLSDSAKYRMLGNSVAIPCVEWITRRMAAYEEVAS